jgi:hypothetical protein
MHLHKPPICTRGALCKSLGNKEPHGTRTAQALAYCQKEGAACLTVIQRNLGKDYRARPGATCPCKATAVPALAALAVVGWSGGAPGGALPIQQASGGLRTASSYAALQLVLNTGGWVFRCAAYHAATGEALEQVLGRKSWEELGGLERLDQGGQPGRVPNRPTVKVGTFVG